MQASRMVMSTVGSSIPMWWALSRQAEQSVEPWIVWSCSWGIVIALIAIRE